MNYGHADTQYATAKQIVNDGPISELMGLLETLRGQALDARNMVRDLSSRIYPQPEQANALGSGSVFGSGYVGMAEEVRSIQSEVIRLLGELSKYA